MVFAASSLTESFQDLASAWATIHPDAPVRTVFAGSQILRLQLEQGAEADVFASANEDHMEALYASGVVDTPAVFAWNELAVIVPTDNPAGIEAFDELPRVERLVIASGAVPVGAYTRDMLARAGSRLGAGFRDGVTARVVSEESNVRLVRAKVELGEADAAVVYRTDALASSAVRLVPIPDDVNVRAAYPVATVTSSLLRARAAEFVAFVCSPEGQAILEAHGFQGGCGAPWASAREGG